MKISPRYKRVIAHEHGISLDKMDALCVKMEELLRVYTNTDADNRENIFSVVAEVQGKMPTQILR